jgi:hypothetical protein
MKGQHANTEYCQRERERERERERATNSLDAQDTRSSKPLFYLFRRLSHLIQFQILRLKSNWFLLCLWTFLCVFLWLFYFYEFSPIIARSPGTDYPIFLLNGDAILNGQIPYLNIYDNKGPVWFFFFMILQLISPWSFISSVFWIFFHNLIIFYLCYKISRVFLSKQLSIIASFAPLIILQFSRLVSPNVEYLSIPYILFCLYVFAQLLTRPKSSMRKQYVINGVCFAIIFWSKYQLVGVWLGAFFAMITLLIIKKVDKPVFKKIVFNHFLGFTVPTCLIFVYFIANNALYEMLNNYFFSRFASPGQSSMIPFSPTAGLDSATNKNGLYLYGILFLLLTALTIISLFSNAIYNTKFKIFIWFAGVFCLILILMGFLVGDIFAVYSRALTPLLCLSVLGIVHVIRAIDKKINFTKQSHVFLRKFVLAFTAFGIIYATSFLYSNTTVVYVWNHNAKLERMTSTDTIRTYKNGPYFQEIFYADWETNHSGEYFYSNDNTFNYYFKKHLQTKYGFTPANPEYYQKRIEEMQTKITSGIINALVVSYELTNSSLPTEQELYAGLVTQCASYEIDAFLKSNFQPTTFVIQDNYLYALFINSSEQPQTTITSIS